MIRLYLVTLPIADGSAIDRRLAALARGLETHEQVGRRFFSGGWG
jgi:hypothetical protein